MAGYRGRSDREVNLERHGEDRERWPFAYLKYLGQCDEKAYLDAEIPGPAGAAMAGWQVLAESPALGLSTQQKIIAI